MASIGPLLATGRIMLVDGWIRHHGLMAMSGPQHAKEAERLLDKARNEKKETTKTNLLLESLANSALANLAAAVYSGPATKDQIRPWEVHGVRV